MVSLFWPEFIMKPDWRYILNEAAIFIHSIHEPLMESPLVLDVQYSKDGRTILYTGSGDTRSNRKGGVR